MGRPRKNPEEILVANTSGVIQLAGAPFIIKRGVTRVRADHPAVKAARHLWKPVDVTYGVEKATAVPGEKRGA